MTVSKDGVRTEGQQRQKHRKRSRARVSMRGQCLLLQISLGIIFFRFEKKKLNHRTNKSVPDV